MTVEPIERKARRNGAADTPPSPDNVWEALRQAQTKFGPIIKGTQGARGKYAPLDAVLEMAVPILNECGLALTQATFVADGTLFVRSSIVHTATSEAHSADYPAGGFALQHQQLGAGVTYARRYSLLSLLGVFPENEDDDGEKAGAAGGDTRASPPPRQQQPTIRAAARPFIDKAKAEIVAAEGDFDAAQVAFDAIKERPGWKQLTSIEQAAIREALPAIPE